MLHEALYCKNSYYASSMMPAGTAASWQMHHAVLIRTCVALLTALPGVDPSQLPENRWTPAMALTPSMAGCDSPELGAACFADALLLSASMAGLLRTNFSCNQQNQFASLTSFDTLLIKPCYDNNVQ